jgi:hypothetical protein
MQLDEIRHAGFQREARMQHVGRGGLQQAGAGRFARRGWRFRERGTTDNRSFGPARSSNVSARRPVLRATS